MVMTTADPIIDADLDAYVDGELDVSRRIAVESYLSEHPATAAKVMADLSLRGELRLALATEADAGRAQTREAARRLERGLAYGRVLHSLQRIAAVAVLVTAGWVAHNSFGAFGAFSATEVSASVPPPAFVDDAVAAYRTSQTRAKMGSQPKETIYNPDDIRASTAIVMPTLPAEWTVADAEIYPSAFGPSVEVTVDAKGKRLSLFAVRPGSFAVAKVDHVSLDGVQAAYWQIGEVAYALVADPAAQNLDGEAERLSRTLY
jgi:anti-sigma factor RsiW